MIDVNLTGVYLCCKYGIEVMRDGGAVVNIGSLSAEAGFVGQANYASAKAGVQGLDARPVASVPGVRSASTP
ncbi:MAG: SDR family oxidoreductase [Isosphaeraceae bacterium]